MAGDSCVVVESEARAREIASTVHGEIVTMRRREVREVQLNRCYLRLPLVKLKNCR